VTNAITWHDNGTLKETVYTDGNDSTKDQTCNYSADDLNRLHSANCGTSVWDQTFTYDPFGNIKKTVPSGATGTAYGASYNTTTNQVSSGISPAPTYDANGNQKTSTPTTLTWNALNQPITVGSTSATYDALGRMVEKAVGSTYTQFVYRPIGTELAVYSGSLVKGTIPLPGGSTAIYNASGVNYIRHKDWLGSSRLATTWAHAVYSKEAYAPFGETYNEAGTADRSFTGQDQNVVTGSGGTGVYDYLFRKYDPSAGRWLSPDPSGWNAVSQSAPQSLNRYAYVENNPMSATDPDGLSCLANNTYDSNGNLVSVTYVDDGDGQGCAAAGVGPGPNGTNDGTVGVTVNGNGPQVPQPPAPGCDMLCQLEYQAVIQGQILLGPSGASGGHAGDQGNGYKGAPYRFPLVLGTNYCGPGGWGPIRSQVDNLCFQHDACYNNAGAGAFNNVFHTGGSSMQAAIASCNLQLCSSLSALQTTSSSEMGQAFFVSLAFGCQ
jgi:RHS repeat-associated protein